MEVLDGYIQLNALLNPAHPSLNYSRSTIIHYIWACSFEDEKDRHQSTIVMDYQMK